MKCVRFIFIVFLLVKLVDKAQAQYNYTPAPEKQTDSKKQDQVKKGTYLQINAGVAVPLGAFASTVAAGYTGGYAMPGATVNLSMGTPIAHSNTGIALMYGYCNNFFDINTYVYNLQVADQSKIYGALAQDSYTENYIMAGLFHTWPLSHFSFDAHAMGGVAFCSLPELLYGAEITGTGSYDDAYEWYYYPSTSRVFAFDAGGDIRYRIHRISVMFGIDFIHSHARLNTVLDYTSPINGIVVSNISGGIPISDISASLGIALYLK